MVAQPTVSIHRSSSHYHELQGRVSTMPPLDSSARQSQELRHPVHTIAAELVDRSQCIRRKALEKLQCALNSSILSTCDPERDTKSLLRSLLEWFNLPSPSHEILVLSMLSRLAQDRENRKLLINLGAVEFMEQYQADCCESISPYVLSLLRNLSEEHDETTSEPLRSMYLMDTGLGYVVPTNHHPTQASRDPVQDTGKSQIQGNLQEYNTACESPARSCTEMSKTCPDIIERNSSLKDKRRGLNSESICDTFSGENKLRRPASSSRGESRASSTFLEADDGHLCRQFSPYDRQDRTDGIKLDSPLRAPESHVLSSPCETDALRPVLPCVRLEESDDKYLFNLNMTLQYLDDREVLVAALKELREAVIIDFHPEAILQKYPIVQNCFSLLLKMEDSHLESMVFDFLLELVRQVKAAVELSKEAGFQVHLENERFPQNVQDNGDSAPEKIQNLEHSYPVYLKPHVDYAPDDSKFVKVLAGRVLDRKEVVQQTISLGRILHTIALQLISLLAVERHRDMGFWVLYNLLPLLRPSSGNFSDGQVQAQFAQYFQALCEVLGAFSENLQDLQILCTHIKGKRSFEKRAHRCSPVLKLLTFSSELLCLLDPAHVTGLVPSTLGKALTILAGDLILSECAFGSLRNIFPYMKYLDPVFFESYTCATEASFTLHVLVKELASSEETVAQWKAEASGTLFTGNTERLLKSMIQAVPHFSFYNYNYLVPRVMHIVPDVLRMELANLCQASSDHNVEEKSKPSKSMFVEDLIAQATCLILLLISHASEPVRRVAYDSLVDVSTKELRQSQQQRKSKPKLHQEWEERCTIRDINIYFDNDNFSCLLQQTSGSLQPLRLLHRLLIFGTSVLGEIVTVGLHDTTTCKQAALLLQHVILSVPARDKARIAPGYSWIACSKNRSTDLELVLEELSTILFPSHLFSPREARGHNEKSFKVEWIQLSIISRSLFSSSTAERRSGSAELLKILRERSLSEDASCWWLTAPDCPDLPFENPERSTMTTDWSHEEQFQFFKDPFQHCLKFEEATLFSLAFGSPTKKSNAEEALKPPQDAGKKVESLLNMLKSAPVDNAIRRTAVEQLTLFAHDLRLKTLLEFDKELFEILVAEIIEWMRTDKNSESAERSNSNNGKPRSIEGLSKSDKGLVALGVACLGLLTWLTAAPTLEGTPYFRDLLIYSSSEIIWLLLPLVFHPSERVRNDMAVLLASLLFNSDTLFQDLGQMGFNHEAINGNVPSAGGYVDDTSHFRHEDIVIAVPRPFIGGHLFPCQVVAVDVRGTDQSAVEALVNEQVVHRLIAQSVLLQGGYENLFISLEKRVICTEDPLQNIELQALACLGVLHAEVTIKKLLKLLTEPQLCCGLETQFLEELEAQSRRHPQTSRQRTFEVLQAVVLLKAAKMLARVSWMVTFKRFLVRNPSNQEESTQLLQVIRLVQVIINSGSADSSGLTFLSTVAKQILLPTLARNPSLKNGANLHHAVVLIEGYAALDMDFTILTLLVDILLASMKHTSGGLFGQTANSLAKGTNLLSVLVSKFVKGPSRPYICCVLAVKCISFVAKGIASALASSSPPSPLSLEYLHQTDQQSVDEASSDREDSARWSPNRNETLQQFGLGGQRECVWTLIGSGLVEVVLPLIKHMAYLHSNHYLSLRHKQLVREIVSCLWSVTCSIPPYLWEDLWFSTGVVHWLSRLLDDQEAMIRGMGFGILSALASPATLKTRSLLEQNWPEIGEIAVCTALNSQECYAVREEALRFLMSSTVWSRTTKSASNEEKNFAPVGFNGIDSLGVNAALRRYKFWMLFPTMLQVKDGTPGFYRAVLELILKLTITDSDFIKRKISVNPHIFHALIKHLEVDIRKGDTDCMHCSDTYCSKAYIGQILCILAQQDDDRILLLIQNESVIAKLLAALSQCLKCQSLGNSTEHGGQEFGKSHTPTIAECCESSASGGLGRVERLEAVIHLAEVLNLVICQMVEADTPPQNSASTHIRIDDVLTFNLRGESPQRRSTRCAIGVIVDKSGICNDISHIIRSAPLAKQISEKEDDSKRGPRSLIKRAYLAICALLATLLSDESLATAVLKCDELQSDKGACDGHLAPLLYNSFLQIMKDVHELGQQPNISHDGASLVYLHTLLLTIGVALQNLLSFSSQAKAAAANSDRPYTFVSYAYEAYTVLGSCGLAPLKNTSVMGTTNHRPKRCNKAFKLINQRIRPLVWSRKAKQGKLSEHHRSLLLGELIICFRLLKNLVFEHPSEAELCVEDGIFDFIRLVWSFSLTEEDLVHEILGLLCNLAAQSDVAKDIIACQAQIYQGGKLGTLMDNVTAIVLCLPSDQLSYTLAIRLLQILVTMAKARAFFLRKQFVSEFLHHFCQSVQNNDVLREQLILQLLINVSVFPNGQKMISRGLSDGRTLDLVLDTVEQTIYVPASSSALFLLRNLAFCRESRFFFLCNERTLPLLVKSLGSSSLEARAHAASALWILTSTERRTSSVLKKIDAWPSLLAAHEASKLHMKIFQAHLQKSAADKQDGRFVAAVSKMGKLVKHIEQSLFAVNQLIGGMHAYG